MKNLTLVIEKKFILRDLLQQIIIISGIFICSSTVARSPLKCPNVKHYNIGVLLQLKFGLCVCMSFCGKKKAYRLQNGWCPGFPEKRLSWP